MSKKDSTHKIQKSIRRILDDPFCVLCNSFPVGHKTQQRIEIWRRLRCVERVFNDGRRRSNLWIGVRKWMKRISGGERGILWKKQDHGIAKTQSDFNSPKWKWHSQENTYLPLKGHTSSVLYATQQKLQFETFSFFSPYLHLPIPGSMMGWVVSSFTPVFHFQNGNHFVSEFWRTLLIDTLLLFHQKPFKKNKEFNAVYCTRICATLAGLSLPTHPRKERICWRRWKCQFGVI